MVVASRLLNSIAAGADHAGEIFVMKVFAFLLALVIAHLEAAADDTCGIPQEVDADTLKVGARHFGLTASMRRSRNSHVQTELVSYGAAAPTRGGSSRR
jgi:hypothetical protein